MSGSGSVPARTGCSDRQPQEAPKLLHRDHVQLDGRLDFLDQAGMLTLAPALVGEVEEVLQRAGNGPVGVPGQQPSLRLHPGGEFVIRIFLRHHTIRPNQRTDKDAEARVRSSAAAAKKAVISRISVSFCSLVLRSL